MQFGAVAATCGLLSVAACQKAQHPTLGESLPPELIPTGLAAAGVGLRIDDVVRLRPATRGMPYTGAFEEMNGGWVIYRTDPAPVDDRGNAMPKSGAVVEEVTIGTEVDTLRVADSLFAAAYDAIRTKLGPPALCMGDSSSSVGRIATWDAEFVVVRLARLRNEQRLPPDARAAPGPLVTIAISRDRSSVTTVGSAFGRNACPP